MPVLVPGHGHSVAAGLAEDLAAPKDDVGTDHLLDQVEDRGVMCQIEEVAAAPHPLAIVAVDMDADQPLGPDSGIFGRSAGRASRAADRSRLPAGDIAG